MERQDVIRQTEVEHEFLQRLLEGLRTTTGWQVQGTDASRKLSTLRFVCQSLQRHLEHLLALEEHDGYMDLVAATAPWLGRATDALRAEHSHFRSEVRRIVSGLEAMPPRDLARLESICRDLGTLIGQIEKHGLKEARLIQEAVAREGGGEG